VCRLRSAWIGDVTDAINPKVRPECIMTTPIVTELCRNGHLISERVELARYTVCTGQRVLLLQCVDGDLQLVDIPAGGTGRSYLIERGLEQDGPGAVNALVVDYLGQSRRLGDVPMASYPLADSWLPLAA
jgi:hypothetical protein